MVRYYRLHARIYDLSRWLFLFGRARLTRAVLESCPDARVLEVGCGTGRNLAQLCRASQNCHCWGVDTSPDMLQRAEQRLKPYNNRVSLTRASYGSQITHHPEGPFDVVMFSYTLSMMNPGWDQALMAARADLTPGGILGVVDFHHSPFQGFQKWMRVNHVAMEGHLLEFMTRQFDIHQLSIHKAYGGIWRYLWMLAGRREAQDLPTPHCRV